MSKKISPLQRGFLLLITFALSALFSCRKTEFGYNELNQKQAENQFYNQQTQLNPTLTALLNSFKKQTAFNNQLSEFIKKNGVPVWDKTIYSIGQNKNSSLESKVKTNSTKNQPNGTQSNFCNCFEYILS